MGKCEQGSNCIFRHSQSASPARGHSGSKSRSGSRGKTNTTTGGSPKPKESAKTTQKDKKAKDNKGEKANTARLTEPVIQGQVVPHRRAVQGNVVAPRGLDAAGRIALTAAVLASAFEGAESLKTQFGRLQAGFDPPLPPSGGALPAFLAKVSDPSPGAPALLSDASREAHPTLSKGGEISEDPLQVHFPGWVKKRAAFRDKFPSYPPDPDRETKQNIPIQIDERLHEDKDYIKAASQKARFDAWELNRELYPRDTTMPDEQGSFFKN